MKKSLEIQSFRAEQGKCRARKEDAVATLQKFARVAKFSQHYKNSQPCEIFAISQPSATFDFFLFLFAFFLISPYEIVFILYTLVICIDLVVYNTPKEHFVGNFLIIEILGKLAEEAPVFSHFSLSHWPNTL